MKTILVAVDLSKITSQVIKKAVELAKPLHAKLILLHVVEPVTSYIPVGAAMDIVSVPLAIPEEEFKKIQAHFEKLAAPIKNDAISIETITTAAFPVTEINEQAAKHHADLIVVGSHGHGGLYHLFTGSVVTGLLKQATRPILVIPVHNKK
ncbi:MAG TPA: universal stress protein [Chthoniobacterales bacterium]|nr:universal stress protein [Chthoniobacterales bacterium]